MNSKKNSELSFLDNNSTASNADNPNLTIPQQDKVSEPLREIHRRGSIGILACGLVHDFKNVLTVILGQAQIAMEDADAEVKDRLSKIIDAARRAADLSNRLLHASHPGLKDATAENLCNMTQDTLKILNATYYEKVWFTSDMPETPIYAKIVPSEYNQILSNLCINAADVTPYGGKVHVTIKMATGDGNATPVEDETSLPMAVLSVKDSGPGLDKSQFDKIFDHFYTTKSNGTGLGLSIVKELADKIGGHVELESNPGAGTEFRIFIPICNRVDSQAPQVSRTPKGSGETIAVIDPSDDILDMMGTILTTYGFKPILASDASSMKKICSVPDCKPSVVVMDTCFLRKTDPDLIDEEKCAYNGIPLILLTTSGAGLPNASQLPGNNGLTIIDKPFSIEEIISAIQKALHAKHS
ncbi:MAG: hypothetical protein JXR97_15235 [Planctomycetes bacterium]|nr:hypothetical protein [Planctomycetota bacterium]